MRLSMNCSMIAVDRRSQNVEQKNSWFLRLRVGQMSRVTLGILWGSNFYICIHYDEQWRHYGGWPPRWHHPGSDTRMI